MKKSIFVILVCVVTFVVCVLAFAQEKEEGMMGTGMMGKGCMMDKQKMMGKCPMCGMMMKKMMNKEIVATNDGGVIVLAGNKLFKYDRDLNLKKEVEIKMDMEGVQKMMQEMMKNCPMRKKMIEEGMMEEGKEKSGGKDTMQEMSK